MTKIIRSLRNGQITIPTDFREQLSITVDTVLQIRLLRGELIIKPLQAIDTVGGSPWVKELYSIFSPVRQEASEKGYSEEKINISIDQALKAVRKNNDKSSL